MKKSFLRFGVLGTVALLAVGLSGFSDPNASGDWPMWGGTPDRNMISDAKGIVSDWNVDPKARKNVKWAAEVGSQNYGNPTVADGKVFVGTNNEGNRDPRQKGDKGVLMAFKEADGKFLWQHVSDK